MNIQTEKLDLIVWISKLNDASTKIIVTEGEMLENGVLIVT